MEAFLITFLVIIILVGLGFLGYYIYGKYYIKSSPPLNSGFRAFRAENDTPFTGCTPKDGQWSIPGAGAQGRSKLASPCCQPPTYQLDPMYKTCANADTETDPVIQACLKQACKFCEVEKGNMDPSWYPLCKCGASLCCYNANVPHFAKYSTCVHYIEGDLAEAETPDEGPVGTGGDWRGYVGF